MSVFEDDKKFIMNTYRRYPVAIKSGKGCTVQDFDGRNYLDMVGGIASVPLGHAHPAILKSISEQSVLTGVSNLFHTENQIKLAKLLVGASGMEKCFFSNSGTEANEAAIKLAIANTGKHEFIACENAFHGRTFGSLSATYDEKYRSKFKPLVPGFKFVKYGDMDAMASAMTPQTAAVVIEPIQGEAGVIVPAEDYLKQLLELCEQKGVLLILDEVQTGNGRTGKYFEYLNHGITPHIVTTAKGLANGLPIGATIARGLDFTPGDHASTFGGNSFCAGVAAKVVETISNGDLMPNAVKQGNKIMRALGEMGKSGGSKIRAVRGKGLLIGIEMKQAAKEQLELLRDKGVLVSIVHNYTIRLTPPLILSGSETDEFLEAIKEVLS